MGRANIPLRGARLTTGAGFTVLGPTRRVGLSVGYTAGRFRTEFAPCQYQSARTAVTKYRRPGDLDDRCLFFLSLEAGRPLLGPRRAVSCV